MNPLISFNSRLSALAPEVVPLAARLVFAGVLLMYFWASAMTKLGDGFAGLFLPSDGAYAQIFPRALEAAGYDSTQLGVLPWLVTVAGTWAEFLLPALIVVGLFTRIAALGMIGFVIVQSLTDVFGHGADSVTIGHWFDRAPDALILDQRALWVVLLLALATMGGGRFSLDALFGTPTRTS